MTRSTAGRTLAWTSVAALALARVAFAQAPTPAPDPCRPEWRGLLGIYGSGPQLIMILEREGTLEAAVQRGHFYTLEAIGPDRFRFPSSGRFASRNVAFSRDASGKAVALRLDEALVPRDPAADGILLRVSPSRPIDELVREAKAASPPRDPAATLRSDLVDVGGLDPSIRVDLRYAGDQNAVGGRVLGASRAFLQRPAAEALVRIHRGLKPKGFGLVVHDAFHPWWITRLVWDAAPPELRRFLDDPARGSGYNRGTTVDVGLYRLADGRAVEMPSLYAEVSLRAYKDFPGGTSEERWHRDLLVEAIEAEDFTVAATQWWRCEFADGDRFPVLDELPGEATESRAP
jgi:D-alanyl-D-alanine dipeptidase